MKSSFLIVLTILGSAAASASPATRPSSSIPDGKVAHFDVAGVRLGMSPDEAFAAFSGKGYKLEHWATGPNFEQRIQEKVSERNPRISKPSYATQTTKTVAWAEGPNGERLWVRFQAMPSGPIVKFVQVSTNERRISAGAVKAQVWAKYGDPTKYRMDSNTNFWCDIPAVACGIDQYDQHPTLSFSTYPEASLKLSDEYRFERVANDAINAEVERRAPKAKAAL
jgi:hypothetical protein